MQIMTRLRDATKDAHSRLESLAYFKRLADHTLPLESYVNQLRALAVLHGVFESEIAVSDDERVTAVWEDGLRKLPLLEEDLEFFKPESVADAPKANAVALAMTEKIRLQRIGNPIGLLGVLYVLEGSTLGNCMHRPDISTAFNLDPPRGCRYYESYGGEVHDHWRRFSEAMNGAVDEPEIQEMVLEAAQEVFSDLESLYTALYPLALPKTPYRATRFNPEAGSHPVPQDEREVDAAIRANERGWAEFGYYRQRYGDRGTKFSASDACWLTTLAALDQASLEKQVDWFNTVLTTRGMPSVMLERTLRFLCQELVAAVPEKAADYEKLRHSADGLKAGRERFISDQDSRDLAGAFDEAIGPDMVADYRNTGTLLVSAVADEMGGIEGAVASVAEWLTDTDRFSGKWVQAVRETLTKARDAAS